jgi:uncharacterized protein involved in exopolysaccharide biosynthesis
MADVSAAEELWNVLRRRWRIVAATVVVLVGATALYCMLATPLYRAQAMVLIDARAPQILANQASNDTQAFTSTKYDYYQTQFTLLRSATLTKRVIDELGLVSDPRFVEFPEAKGAPIESWHVGQYLENLAIMPVRNTRLVGIQYLSPDPDLSADVANAHARLFVRSGLEGLYAAMEQIRGFLQGKLAELQPRMQDAERKLLDFQAEHKLMPVHISKDVASERLMDLSRRLTAAEADRIAQEAQYQLVKKRDYESLPAVIGNGLVQKLRGDLNHLEVEYALLAGKFKPGYPQMKQLGGQVERARQLIKAEIQKVVDGVESSYLLAERNVEKLKAELEAQRQSVLGRTDVEGELLTLVREAETTRALYDNILARVKELDVTGGSDASNISVTELAVAPTWPASPATRLYMLISMVTALLLGSGLAFLRDSWDRTVRDAQSIRTATGLATLAVVPDFDAPPHGSLNDAVRWQAGRARQLARIGWRRATPNGNGKTVEPDGAVASPRLLLGDGHEPPSAEAYRTLRTSLLLSRDGGAPRVIVISSATGTEGKTTTAVNTAAALASSGAPVLLIDGDLRLPRCHDSLKLPLDPGLSEYLAGETSAEPIQPTGVPNLSFLAADASAPTRPSFSPRGASGCSSGRHGRPSTSSSSTPRRSWR